MFAVVQGWLPIAPSLLRNVPVWMINLMVTPRTDRESVRGFLLKNKPFFLQVLGPAGFIRKALTVAESVAKVILMVWGRGRRRKEWRTHQIRSPAPGSGM